MIAFAALLCALGCRAPTALAAPFTFRDDYTSLSAVDSAATTAAVMTATPGVVRLPFAPMEAAFDPSGGYALVAGPGGVSAYLFDGSQVRAIPDLHMNGFAATGVTWIAGGAAFAVATAQGLAVYGLSAQEGERVAAVAASAAFSGGTIVAPGPVGLPSSVLLATATGAVLWEAAGTHLVVLSGGPAGLQGNAGVSATTDGAVAATWAGRAVQIWAWDGSAYRRTPAWDPPAQSQTVQGVAFFPHGGGYWVLTSAGEASGYAYGAAGVQALTQWSVRVPSVPDPPITAASGWSEGGLATVYPWGWTYWDVPVSGGLADDAARSLGGQRWPVYVPSAVLQSSVLDSGHPVAMLRVEDADCLAGQPVGQCGNQAALPPGTALAYAVSTDGCVAWTPAPLWSNVAVPNGTQVCYRVTLSTTDPSVTPVLDVTDIYEIALETAAGEVPSLLCAATCP